MVLFAPDGDEVKIENPFDAKATLEVLLIGGVPLNEPISRHGPFVMNPESEIRQAIEDYRLGRMARLILDWLRRCFGRYNRPGLRTHRSNAKHV
jgi:hypothetical protein